MIKFGEVGIRIGTELSEELLSRRRARAAFLYPEPVPGDSRDLRQLAPGAASSVTSRWVGRVRAT